MKLKFFKKNKRGISPIMADVLLLSIIVSLMMVVWTFALMYTQNYQTKQGASIMERILIDDVNFYNRTAGKDVLTCLSNRTRGNLVNITIYNYGKLSINITAAIVFINGTARSFTVTPRSTLIVGNHSTITATFAWRAQNSYAIKIVTERGYTVEGTYTAPDG